MKINKLFLMLGAAFFTFSTFTFTACSTGGSGTGTESETGTGNTGGEMKTDTVINEMDIEEPIEKGNQDDDIGTGTEGLDSINEVK
ncbi:MAG: hypothetical protein ACXWEY_07680 [Bacteroidia bacterium]